MQMVQSRPRNEITSDISLRKQNLWKEYLNANWDHRHNTHTLWKTIVIYYFLVSPIELQIRLTDLLIELLISYPIILSLAIQHSKNNNSVGPDNLSIRHLKHIGPLGLTFLTSMYTTALNKNIIPHMWKLANIIPIPKPNKDTNIGTSYRPISLLSLVAKTLEKCLLPLYHSKHNTNTH